VARQIFSGLVRLDNDLDVQPDLAESWEISDDGRTYTFTLQPDARFADGTPLTSEDVQYSLERATDPGLGPFLPAQTYLTDIVGVREKLAGEADTISGLEVIDEQTIALTIDEPKSFFLAKLTHPTSYVVDQAAVEQGGANWTDAPNGSGPFEIERWDHNQQLVLRRNLNFHRDLAKLDRVNFLIGASASNPMVLYEQGDIDLTGVPSYALDRVQDVNNPLSQELVSVPQLSLTFVGMNTSMPPFDDINVRRAFVQMLDRQKVAEVSLFGSVEPARGILPPGIPGYNTQLAEQPAPTADLEQAADLLEQSRYEGAENLPQVVAYGSGWTGTISEIAEEEFDIDIDVRDYENFGDYLTALEENEFPLFSFGWVADYPDPENFLDVLFRTNSGENHLSYSNPEVDALLEQAATEEDEAARWELYQEIEQQILQDAPIIPIYHDVEHMLIKPYVRGLEVTPMGILDLSTVELVRG
jgi:ABC-type transport system substrate-binding protein